MTTIAKLRFLVTLLGLFGMIGCGSIGSSTVARDRFAYTDAISESWKRQMLLNMVKIRYADAPVFLEVASVINQYALETELSASAGWDQFLNKTDSQLLGARGRYADRPTITYQPLVGDKFTRSLMTPIPPAAFLSLIQAGWRADMVFRIGVQAVNGIYNRVGGRIETRSADPDFYRLMASLRKMQKNTAIGMRRQETKDKKTSAEFFFRDKDIQPDINAEIKATKTLLGLDPEQQEYHVVYGVLAKNDQEIAILSRSMLEILQELASYIEVPVTHVTEHRTMATVAVDTDAANGVRPLIRIQSGKEKTANAFVAVHYRNHWYWIDDRDYASKRMFSFLMFLFTLAETGPSGQAPLITVPTG